MTGEAADHGVRRLEARVDPVAAGLPQATPVIVVRVPWIQRTARKAKQPPAASSEPVLTPTNPSRPSSVSVLRTMPATGSHALGVATMLASTGTRIARSTMRT